VIAQVDAVGGRVGSAAQRPTRGSGGEAPERPSTAGADTLSQAWRVVLAAGRVLVPGSLVVSLFFYFGLRYTHDHYLQYGLDDSGLGLSTTDYVVRSLNVTVQPARMVALAAIAGVAVHMVLAVALRLANHVRPAADARIARLLGLMLVAAGVAGVLLFWSPDRLDLEPVTSAGWWLASVLMVMYGLYLGSMRARPTGRAWTLVREALDDREWRIVTSLLLAIAVVLVAHGAFEFTRAYARERAIQQALHNEATPWAFPLVRIYSKVDLALDDQLGVVEEVLPGEEGAYRYRYINLRLFLQHNDRLVLWPAGRSPRSGMFILRESDDLRVEYQPELR
jgi:hypothetical protein